MKNKKNMVLLLLLLLCIEITTQNITFFIHAKNVKEYQPSQVTENIDIIKEPITTSALTTTSETIETIVTTTNEKIEQKSKENIVDLGEFVITSYCACSECCDEWATNRPVDANGNIIVIGANGTELQNDYSVAVDPDVIPLGSTIIINDKEYVAEDVGGEIKGNRIDLYKTNHVDAQNYGIQYANVKIKK